ncbi:hypothetical protein AVEN_148991-1, partial [Araneus ventricosus]
IALVRGRSCLSIKRPQAAQADRLSHSQHPSKIENRTRDLRRSSDMG